MFTSVIVTVAIALAGFFGATTPTSATPTPATSASVECMEDQPCWDCETMGNRECGTDPAMEADAFLSYDTQIGQPNTDASLMLSYVASAPMEPTALTATQFAIPSSELPNVWHILQWDTVQDA